MSKHSRNGHARPPPSPSAAAASAASPPTPTLLLHHAAFKNDAVELRRLLAVKQYDVNSVDLYGNTALHLCVMLRHVECASLLLDAGARVGVKNKEGWTALHEAASIGDRDLLRRLWSAYKVRAAAAQELSGFLTHLHSVPDFSVTFKWKVESWLPFVGRWLPSDSITLSKRGARIRVDTNMLEFKNMAWVHHPYSFLLRPRHEPGEEAVGAAAPAAAAAAPAAASAASSAAPAPGLSAESVAAAQNPRQPFLVFTMDHELKKWQCVNTDEEKEAAEAERLWKQQHEAEMKQKQQQKDEGANAASSAAAAAAASSSSVAVAAVPASGAPVDVDLEYELDDWMSAPIASAFSPGRLQFKPVTARSWRSWSSWTSLLGVGTAPQRVESVAHWRASVWSVDQIRVHMLKRFEHLSPEEIKKVQQSSSNFKSMLSDPVKLRKALKEKEKEEEEEEEDGEEGAEHKSGAEGEQQKKKKKKKEDSEEKHVHRASLAPPAPCGVSFATYFHSNNQRAYTVMDAEERFDAARDAAIDDAAHAASGPQPAHVQLLAEEAIDLPEEKEEGEGANDDDDAEEEEEEEEGEDDGEDTSAVLDEEPDHGSSAAAAPLSPPAPAPAHTLPTDSDAADAAYIHLGRPMLQQLTRKKYSARLWCAEQFPLPMATVVHVVRLLFAKTYPQVVSKFEQFALRELPPGFPVRITAPVLPCVAVDIAIVAFAQGGDIRYGDDDGGSDPQAHARHFRIPTNYTREEESEEEQHKRQQRYRKRWAAAESKTRKEDSAATAAAAAPKKKDSVSSSSASAR